MYGRRIPGVTLGAINTSIRLWEQNYANCSDENRLATLCGMRKRYEDLKINYKLTPEKIEILRQESEKFRWLHDLLKNNPIPPI